MSIPYSESKPSHPSEYTSVSMHVHHTHIYFFQTLQSAQLFININSHHFSLPISATSYHHPFKVTPSHANPLPNIYSFTSSHTLATSYLQLFLSLNLLHPAISAVRPLPACLLPSAIYPHSFSNPCSLSPTLIQWRYHHDHPSPSTRRHEPALPGWL